MHRPLARTSLLTLAGALLVWPLAAGGCARNKELPKTYPASGTVLGSDGKPLAGGTVEFRPTANSTVTTVGALRKDGSFTLDTIVGTEKVPGATEGEHRVTVVPVSTDRSVRPVTLKQKYVVSAYGENHFDIKVDLPRRKR